MELVDPIEHERKCPQADTYNEVTRSKAFLEEGEESLLSRSEGASSVTVRLKW